jgi:hypothetical protein
VVDNIGGQLVCGNNGAARCYVLKLGDDKSLKLVEYSGQITQGSLGEHKYFFKKMINQLEGHIIYEVVQSYNNTGIQYYIKSLIKEALKDSKKHNRYSYFKSHDYVYKVR